MTSILLLLIQERDKEGIEDSNTYSQFQYSSRELPR